jgi:hypothetical protein
LKSLLLSATLVAIFVCPFARATAQDSTSITEAELLHRTQVLYDAVASGDRAPWTQYLADDVIIHDEKGGAYNKATFLPTVEPLPAGYTGIIKVVHPETIFAPGVAIFSYDLDESETVFTAQLHARYHVTDTWLYRNHLWQIAASQALRYYEDPAIGAVNAHLLNDYVGTYELAPGNQMMITRNGDKLFAQRGSAKPVELLPESPDMFFRAGIEGRRLFHRNAAGKVDLLIDRRNNEDLLWKKIG